LVEGTIWREQQGYWLKGSRDMAALRGKWMNEQPAYVFRDRSLMLPERGSPAALVIDQSSLVTGFLLGVVASYVAGYVYKPKRRRR
jgi:hypothetical protein